MKNGEAEVENTGAETLGQEKKARKRLSFLGHRCFSNHCYSSFVNHNANDWRKRRQKASLAISFLREGFTSTPQVSNLNLSGDSES